MDHILFVCTGNAGRSQMAEALFRERAPQNVRVLSAGVDPWDDLHPVARKLMAERGLDLTGHHPKHVRTFVDRDVDVVVTIGDRAHAETPDFRTGTRRIHWEIGDPADADGTPDSEPVFRRTRAQIEDRLPGVIALVESLPPRRASTDALAISTAVLRPETFSPSVHVPLLAEAGFRHLELCCYMDAADFPWEDAAAVAELKTVTTDLGVTVVALHPPDSGNLAAPEESSRETQVDVLRRFTDLAADLGAASLSIHAGYGLPVDGSRTDALTRQDEALDRLEAYVLESPVVLCLETLSGRDADMPNPDLIRMAHRRSAAAFGVVLDTGHAHIAGDLTGLAQTSGRRLQNLHLHDNDGRGDLHLVPGAGTIDWTQFMGGLRNSGYEGPLTLEVCPGNPGDLRTRLAACHEAAERLRSPSV